ncbi:MULTISPECIES: hypothetical protein [unclassified Lentimonas]|uniref:hypothetical protein n=1 Tax=unclassified Lentimonas TaxID=2630993 RepID=UPI00138A3867|nr:MULTISPECIES: hypothetical protein [unclassified Lentimonas]
MAQTFRDTVLVSALWATRALVLNVLESQRERYRELGHEKSAVSEEPRFYC